ncbi:MAG TPA: DPP IV N-terminal domain-containing protein [Pyrinomonadaceae bacterium]|jgi:Tol biopolymer transport system component
MKLKKIKLIAALMLMPTASLFAQTKTVNNRQPSWHLSGRIYFSSNRDADNAEVYSVKTNGRDLKRLVTSPGEDATPRWSADGRHGVFMTTRDGGDYEIYSIDADGKNEKRLTFNKGSDWDPSWSPDGKKIVFMSSKDGNWEIYTMNADGSNQTRLTENNFRDFSPMWSPDGKKILFCSERATETKSGALNDTDIYTMNPDGSNQVKITNAKGFDGAPEWSPDGRRIVFFSNRDGGKHEIYVMNADGSSPTRLTFNEAMDVYPVWSPDGKKIAFESDRDVHREVYIMSANGKNQKPLLAESNAAISKSKTK